MSVRIHGREHNPRDVEYFFTSEWDDETQAHASGVAPDYYGLYVEGPCGGTQIGKAYSEDAARKIHDFARR